MLWRIRKYIIHSFYLTKRRGHGIHSPYIFEFVNKVVFNGAGTKVPGEISKIHRKLKRDRTKIPVSGPGAASRVDASEERSVASFVRGSSVTEKYGALLHRIVYWFQPEEIFELGTGLGVSALYLSSGYPAARLHSIEGNQSRASFARQLIAGWSRGGDPGEDAGGTIVHCGEMGEKLEELLHLSGDRFVAFMDGNHRREPTLAYARKLFDLAGEEAVIIVDDIYWSKEMNQAWKELISWPQVRVSVDLFQLGILLLRRDLAKADIKIKF